MLIVFILFISSFSAGIFLMAGENEWLLLEMILIVISSVLLGEKLEWKLFLFPKKVEKE